jgi:hypothetical protein
MLLNVIVPVAAGKGRVPSCSWELRGSDESRSRRRAESLLLLTWGTGLISLKIEQREKRTYSSQQLRWRRIARRAGG